MNQTLARGTARRSTHTRSTASAATAAAKSSSGGYEVKTHGDGSWGSGTCPQCGTHTYTGRSCTSKGVCACGSTQPAYGHSYGSIYSEAAHPHKYYHTCSRCSKKEYTSGTETKTHGDGSWGSGTCPDCGTHTYSVLISQLEHPHETRYRCDCGSSYSVYNLSATCSRCKANTRVASSSNSVTDTISYIASGDGAAAPVYVSITLVVEYTNTYNYPKQNEGILTSYPEFASFSSRVYPYPERRPIGQPDVYTTASRDVVYYSQSGGRLATQRLTATAGASAGDIAAWSTSIYTLNSKPGSAQASATCSMSGTADYFTATTTANFAS